MDPSRKISQSRSPGRESIQRLCTCFQTYLRAIYYLLFEGDFGVFIEINVSIV